MTRLKSLQRLKLRYRILAVLALLVIAFVSLLPIAVEKGMAYYLEEQGAEQVEVGDVDLNLFTGRFQVSELTMMTQKKQRLDLGLFELNLDISALFEKRIQLENLVLKQTEVEIILGEQQKVLRVAGIDIPLVSKSTDPETEDAEHTPWGFGLNHLVLQQTQVHFSMPRFSKTIGFEEVTLSDAFNWQPDQAIPLAFKLQLGEGRLEGEWRLKPFAEQPSWDGQLDVQALDLAQYGGLLPPEMQLQGVVSGSLHAKGHEHKGELKTELSGQWQLEALDYAQAKQRVALNKLAWEGQLALDWQAPHWQVKTSGQWALDTLDAKVEQQSLALQQLSWNGQLEAGFEDEAWQLISDGKWHLGGVKAAAKQQSLALQKLDWDGQVKADLRDEQLQLMLEGDWGLAGMRAKQATQSVQLDQLNWRGSAFTQAGLQAAEGETLPVQVQWTGSLGLEGVRAQDAMARRVSLEGFSWQGQWAFDSMAKTLATVSGEVATKALRVEDTRNRLNLVQLDAASTDLELQWPLVLEMKQLQLNGFALAQPLTEANTPAMLSLGEMKIAHVQMPSETHLTSSKVRLKDLQVPLHLNQQQQWQQLESLKAALTGESSDKSQAEPHHANEKETVASAPGASNPFGFSVAGVQLSGDNSVEVTSAAMQPPLEKRVQIQQFEIGALDSARPARMTPVDFKGQIDKYTQVSLKGEMAPLDAKQNLSMKADIQNLDLYDFSPVIRQALGYRIRSGSLNLNSDIQVKNDLLDSKNHVKLTGFEMASESTQNNQTTTSSFGSIPIALNLLRDSNDVIELDVPVKGNLASPDFEIGQVINVALLNALKGGTKTYLALMLQPYGSIYVAAEYAYKKLGQVRLQPVVFEPGTTDLREDMPAYLQKLKALMEQKPDLNLKVCGYYNTLDQSVLQKQGLQDDALQAKLNSLATQRQSQIKTWLVEQGEVSASRLTTCHPDFEDQAQPGVLLSM